MLEHDDIGFGIKLGVIPAERSESRDPCRGIDEGHGGGICLWRVLALVPCISFTEWVPARAPPDQVRGRLAGMTASHTRFLVFAIHTDPKLGIKVPPFDTKGVREVRAF